MADSPTVQHEDAAFKAAEQAPLAANLVGGGAARSRAGHGRSGEGYSRFVRTSKVALPFLALGLIALVIIWPRLQTDDTFRIGFASVNLTGETEAGMDNARYVGTDENRQPFSVTADLARNASGQNSVSEQNFVVDLELPKADITLEDGTWLVLTANTGRYTQRDKHLELNGGVNLFHDTGYEITTEQLSVDLNAGNAVGNESLEGHGPFGELKAQGLELIDKGRVIHFTGPAQLIMFMPEEDAQ